MEIGATTSKVMLGCDVQQTIEENALKMIMMNYKQVDRLHGILGNTFVPISLR